MTSMSTPAFGISTITSSRCSLPRLLHVATCAFAMLLLLVFPTATTHARQLDPAAADSTMSELHFRDKIETALTRVRSLLDQTRSPRIQPASSVEHAYDDKYALTEWVANSAIAATVNVLDRIGLDSDRLARLRAELVEGGKSVTLRFEAVESCSFVREKVVEVSSPRAETYETTSNGIVEKLTGTKKTTTKVVKEVTEYHWDYSLDYTLVAFTGSDPKAEDSRTELSKRAGTGSIIVSGSKRSPLPQRTSPTTVDVDLSWLLRQLDNPENEGNDDLLSRFRIERDVDSCHTPRRNDDVDRAFEFFSSLRIWGGRVGRYLQYDVPRRASSIGYFADEEDPGKQSTAELLASVDDTSVFVPVLPIFEDKKTEAEAEAENADDNKPLLSSGDVELFLNEQCRSLDALLQDLTGRFPSEEGQTLASSAEAKMILLARHLASVSTGFNDGVNDVEAMLRSQLIAAIGKEVRPSDFDEFTRTYYPKLLRADYVPEPFVYSIRRPHHYPDGTVTIEAANGGEEGSHLPIVTTTKKLEASVPMYVPINAATKVAVAGARYLHAWVRNDFEGDFQQSGGINIIARARQFSSFLLVVGNIAGPDTFQPQSAIILQNKDEVLLPLLLEQLPTPKEFKDAIQSLSPEQRAFATAFRNMQLESSVFGVLVIQLKPQLESVLGLPYDSLTKEIRLTQDLLTLFIDHQIPSDLLTYDREDGASVADKIARVKTHVSSVQEMLEDAKKKELEEAKMESDMRAEMKHQRQQSPTGDKVYSATAYSSMPSSADASPNRRGARRLHAEMMESEPIMMAASFSSASESHPKLRKADVPPGQTSESQRFTIENGGDGEGAFVGNSVDLTLIPKQLDLKFEALDKDSALRPTKIKTGDTWTKRYQKSLLTSLQTKTLGKDDQKSEKEKAFDLLDALSKSGAMPVDYAELHVMVAATHRFDKSLIDTIVVDNVNPIQKMERSLLIVSSTINNVPVAELLNEARVPEIAKHSPALLEAPSPKTTKGDDGEERESTLW